MNRGCSGLALLIIILLSFACLSCTTRRAQTYYITDINAQEIKRVKHVYGYVLRSMNATGNYTFAVIRSDELDALAACDKKRVFITSGLVNRLDNYELGFVLAHEVSHIKHNHCLTTQVISGSISFLAMVAGVIVPGAGLADYAVNPLVTRGFSRSQEREADLDAAVAFKGAAEGGERAFVKFRKYAEAHGKETGGGWLSSHPDVNERIEAMRAARNGTAQGAPQDTAVTAQP